MNAAMTCLADGMDGARAAVETREVDAVVDAFVDRYDAMLRLRPTADAFAERGRRCLAARVRPFVEAGRPVELVLPGFAHKNGNRDKTLGDLPDLAEVSALDHLEAFCTAIDAVYVPLGHAMGCRLTLVSDGRVWAGLVGVEAETAGRYGVELRRMAAARRHLRVVGLDALLDRPTAAALEEEFATPALRAAIEAGLATPWSPLGQQAARFVELAEEDGLPVLAAAGSPVAAARPMLVRHAAFGALVDARFPAHVRLSVHARDDAGPRFSCRFGPAVPARGETPPLPDHGAALRSADGRAVRFVRAAEGLRGGATIRTLCDRPWCLRAPRRMPS